MLQQHMISSKSLFIKLPLPVMPGMEFMRGSAWGTQVFRGRVSAREVRIETGHRADWRLVPKDEEEELCRLAQESVYNPVREIPSDMNLPPLLEALYKQHLDAKGESIDGPISVKLRLRCAKKTQFDVSEQI